MDNNHNLAPEEVEVEEGSDDLDPVPDLSNKQMNMDNNPNLAPEEVEEDIDDLDPVPDLSKEQMNIDNNQNLAPEEEEVEEDIDDLDPVLDLSKEQMNIDNNQNLAPEEVEVEEDIDDLDPVLDLSKEQMNIDNNQNLAPEEEEEEEDIDDLDPVYSDLKKELMNMENNHHSAPGKVEVEEGFDDLDPVPDLSTLDINADEEVFQHMGNVLAVVMDRVATIEALPDTPAYDLDTLLFIDEGKRPLGFVYDVLGQVNSPMYAVRFNTAEDVKKLQITSGTKVYAAAPKSKHTQCVFVKQLLKMKGSDASGVNDVEVPEEDSDYSDDESEYYATLAAGSQNEADSSFTDSASTVTRSSIGGVGSSGTDIHKRTYKQARRRVMPRQSSDGGSGGGGGGRRGAGGAPSTIPSSGAAALLPTSYDPTIPPPNMFSPPTFYPATPPIANMFGPYHHTPFAPHGIAVPSPFQHSPSPSSSFTNTSRYSQPQTGMFTPPHNFYHDYFGRSPVDDNNNSRRLPPPPSAAAPLNSIPGNFINPAMLALNQSQSFSLPPPPPPPSPHQSQQNWPPVWQMQQAPPLEPTNFATAPPPTGGSRQYPPAGPSHR